MEWMQTTAARRADPRNLWPQVRSIIMLGVNYGREDNPLTSLERRSQGTISVYAQSNDYQDIIKPMLERVGRGTMISDQ
jgi:epoxyqueuosine reductase